MEKAERKEKRVKTKENRRVVRRVLGFMLKTA